MANDVFGFETKIGNNFVESEMGVMIGGGGALSLVQDWNVQYNLNMQPVYECGTSTVYFSAKHGSGNLTCNRIVAEGFSSIKESLGDICSPQTVNVEAYSGQCTSVTAVTMVMTGSILSGVSFSGNAQNAYVGENLTASFVGLEVN